MSRVNVVSAAVTPRLKLNLVASVAIRRGEVVFACRPGEIQGERTWRTLQIDHGRHVNNQYLDYVDHSCEPNSLFDIPSLSLVAIRDIPEGEVVTFFYPGAEVELAQEFDCHCGSAHCLRQIKGAFYLTKAQMQWALESGYCTTFMRAQLLRLLG